MNHTTTLVEANKQNIEKAFDAIRKFAEENGYQLKGELKMPTNMLGVKKDPKFVSMSQEKVVKHFLTRLDRKVTMREANKFLHFLHKNIEPFSATKEKPYIDYPEQMLKIWRYRTTWKKAQEEAEKLRLAYKIEKGDYFKKPKKMAA